MRQRRARAGPDDRDGHPRPGGGVATPTASSSSPTAAIVDEMADPTADMVLDRMKSFGGARSPCSDTHHSKNLLAARKKLRLLTTGLAVMLGVAFMAGTLVLTDTIEPDVRRPLRRRLRRHRRLRPRRRPSSTPATRRPARPPRRSPSSTPSPASTASPPPRARSRLRPARRQRRQGRSATPAMGAPTFGASWLTDDELNPFELADGRAPRARRRGRHRPGSPPRPPTSPSATRPPC